MDLTKGSFKFRLKKKNVQYKKDAPGGASMILRIGNYFIVWNGCYEPAF